MGVAQNLRDVRRLRQIISVLFKYDFGYLMKEIGLHHHLSLSKKNVIKKYKEKELKKIAKNLRLAFEELGGTFVKLGQLLSLRPDLVPEEFCDEFRRLQDNVRPFSLIEVKKIIKEDLKEDLGKIFSNFSQTPVAAASIAQVHKAKLKKSGKIVAVKVQRPKIREVIETDIDIIQHIANLIEKHSKGKLKDIRPLTIVEEFKHYTENELDFRIEASNAQRLYTNLKEDTSSKIPEMYFEYTTERVLVMEYLNGIHLVKTQEVKRKFLNKREIIKNYLDSMFRQVFVDGFFHGDPHPANIIVQKNRKIGFVDFGIVGELNEEIRISFLYGVNALLNRDGVGTIDAILKIGEPSEGTDVEAFKKEALINFNKLFGSYTEKASQANVLLALINTAGRHRINYPRDIVLFVKALVTMEGTVVSLDSRVKYVREMDNRVKVLMKRKIKPTEFMNEGKKFFYEFAGLMKKFPKRADNIMRKLEKDKLDVEIEKKEIREIEREITKTSNEKTVAIITAALLVCSVLLLQMENQPIFLGIKLSIILFLIAVIFVIYLFIQLSIKK